MKSRGGKSQRREKKKKRSEKRKSQKKEDASAQKGRKVAQRFFYPFFPMFCGSGRSTSRRAKAAGAEPSGQMRDEKIARRCGAKDISKSKC